MTRIHTPELTPSDPLLDIAVDTLKMLADRTRLHLLAALTHGPADVTTLVETVAASRTAVSQHLAKLRLAGLVVSQKTSRTVTYSVPDGHLVTLLTEILSHADHRITGAVLHSPFQMD